MQNNNELKIKIKRRLPVFLTADAAKCGVIFPAQRPIYNNPPNIKNMLEWAESQHTPKLREIAHIIVNNINHISFQKFIENLHYTVNDFNDKIGNSPYILIISSHNLRHRKSDGWVASLAIELGLVYPNKIISADKTAEFLKNNPDIKNALILDDAGYSGQQKSCMISVILSSLKKQQIDAFKLYIGIPFLTQTAINTFCTYKMFSSSFNLEILKYEKLHELSGVLDGNISYLHELGLYLNDGVTLTYFQHKIPDCYSFLTQCYEGTPLIKEFTNLLEFHGFTMWQYKAERKKIKEIDFEKYQELMDTYQINNKDYSGYNIPVTIPPYRIDNESEKIKQCIENGAIGARNFYMIYNHALRRTVLETCFEKAKFDTGYQKPKIDLEEQVEIDKRIFLAVKVKERLIEQESACNEGFSAQASKKFKR